MWEEGHEAPFTLLLDVLDWTTKLLDFLKLIFYVSISSCWLLMCFNKHEFQEYS